MNYTILASGSRGNCTLIYGGNHLIMVDCGIPKTELYNKLETLKIDPSTIEAVLVTHEHIDHIRSINEFSLSKLYSLKGSCKEEGTHVLEAYQKVQIAGFEVMPFTTSHDVVNPCGYIIKNGTETMVYVTDTGYIKESDYQYFQNATHYIMESNYDNEMLLNSKRPWQLQQRIRSMEGHLSNESSARILASVIGPSTKSIRLAHVSEDCNTKEIVLDTLFDIFDQYGIAYQDIDIKVADRYVITEGVKNDENR